MASSDVTTVEMTGLERVAMHLFTASLQGLVGFSQGIAISGHFNLSHDHMLQKRRWKLYGYSNLAPEVTKLQFYHI